MAHPKPDTRPASRDAAREQAIGLYTFLLELVRSRSRAVRSVEQYEPENVLWLSDIPSGPGCLCAIGRTEPTDEPPEKWLEIRKPPIEDPPLPVPELRPWLDPEQLADSESDIPALRLRIIDPRSQRSPNDTGVDDTPRWLELKDHPRVEELWEKYIDDAWSPWAEEDRPLQRVQNVYNQLFSMYQRQQRLGEQFELVLGLGLLAWRPQNAKEIKRHLLVAHCELVFDGDRGEILLVAAGEGSKLTLEQEMIDQPLRPSQDELSTIQEQIGDIGEAIWDTGRVKIPLVHWVNAVSAEGMYDASALPPRQLRDAPRIHLAPALILRKRTERSLIRMFEAILEGLREGAPLSPALEQIVAPPRVEPGAPAETVEDRDSPGLAPETYFPLPSNAEQRQIKEHLEAHPGVLVQGPPGTGKSHTIINLICHLLAEGKRVLVTSHAPRALQVLRKFLKKEVSAVAALAVVLLGNDREALQTMEDSVQGITDRHSSWDLGRSVAELEKLESKLDSTRREAAERQQELRSILERETYRHRPGIGDYEGTAQSLAIRLANEAPRFEWVSDMPASDAEFPLDDVRTRKLLHLLRDTALSAEDGLPPVVVNPSELIQPDEFARRVQAEKDACNRYEGMRRADGDTLCALVARLATDQLLDLQAELDQLLSTYEEVLSHVQPWTAQAASDALADQSGPWAELLRLTRSELDLITEPASWADTVTLSGLGDRDRGAVKVDAQALRTHLQGGGKKGFGPLRPAVVRRTKYLLYETHLNGDLCDSEQKLQDLWSFLDLQDRIDRLKQSWQEHTTINSTQFRGAVAELTDLCKPLTLALSLWPRLHRIRDMVSALPPLPDVIWHEPKHLHRLLDATKAVQAERGFKEARQAVDAAADPLLGVPPRDSERAETTGLLDAVKSRDAGSYEEHYRSLLQSHEVAQRMRERDDLLAQVESASPLLAIDLQTNADDEVWDERIGELGDAWNWARTRCWLEQLPDAAALIPLGAQVKELEERSRALLGQIAAVKAWQHCFRRMTEHERRHLVSWAQACRRVGKGTGKYAAQYRRDAQGHMEQCRSAIPVWIMPLYRAAETFRPGQEEPFDVVIVDEASQAGPDALFLLSLAKKVVVVGDDKQISPPAVGRSMEVVKELRERHIRNLEHSDRYEEQTSLFSLANIYYPGQIRLREHFRCMPEIIQFSNNLCYQSEPLIPLRQYGTDRLDPVNVVQVPDGYRKGQRGRIVNPPEAKALADQIAACCRDPKYADLTMGVISLQASGQAREIERLLLDSIGPAEMERRELVCGDAYSFQGSERDVMFLSLVAAPSAEHRIGTLSRTADEQRFNVAASRAKLQMWLFHTATLNDLSPKCVRYKLLQYYQNPTVASPGGIDRAALSQAVLRPNRRKGEQPPPFDSWFEVDVCLKITGRGFRVIPQYEVAGRYIDLVVQGMQGALAVECDGDESHPPEQYEADLARQRDLERCGWTFWRVAGSTFYRDPDAALESLWQELRDLGISPEGQEPTTSPDVPAEGASPPSAPTSATNEQCRTSVPDERPSQRPPQATLVARGAQSGAGPPPPLVSEPPHTVRPEPTGSTGAVRIIDRPYKRWAVRPLPDPRTAQVEGIAQGLAEIVDAEGPMPTDLAFRHFANAAGIKRVRKNVYGGLVNGLDKAIRDGLVTKRTEMDNGSLGAIVIRKPGSPAIIVRSAGGRKLEEVPPSEIAELMFRLRKWFPPISQMYEWNPRLSQTEFYRAVLDHYGLKRLTRGVREWLAWIEAKETQLRDQDRFAQ